MSKKKIVLIILLIVIIVAIIFVLTNSKKKSESVASPNNALATEHSSTDANNIDKSDSQEIIVSNLSDGTLYATTDEEVKADIVIGDNYFDTQIADINLNFSSYEGKTIEIEGMYLTNTPYTFVGRYSTSNLCPDCPPGYSFFEYQFSSANLPDLKDEEDWIKVIGTLKKDYDSSIESDYYYIDVISLEVMNEKGIETVSN